MQLKGVYLDSVKYSVGDIVLFTDGKVYHMIADAKKGTKPHNNLFWNRVDQKLEEAIVCFMSLQEGARKASTTVGKSSAVFGYNAEASGINSFAVGGAVKASGSCSFAQGVSTTASGDNAVAINANTTAKGDNSFAAGEYTYAKHRNQVALGKYNITDPSSAQSINAGNYIVIVGNGTASNARSNAMTLDWDGNEWLAGSVEPVGGLILKSSTASSTKRFMITVDDDGELTATEIT